LLRIGCGAARLTTQTQAASHAAITIIQKPILADPAIAVS